MQLRPCRLASRQLVERPAELGRERGRERRREVMLVAIDLVLSGEGLGLETALDLVREVWHCYPESSAHWDEV